MRGRPLFVVLSIFAVLWATETLAQSADTVLTHGKILTVEPPIQEIGGGPNGEAGRLP